MRNVDLKERNFDFKVQNFDLNVRQEAKFPFGSATKSYISISNLAKLEIPI